MRVSTAALSDIGRKRANNEDSFLLDEQLRIYVVADGMGGHRAGEIASGKSIEMLSEKVAEHAAILDAAPNSADGAYKALRVFERALARVNTRLYELSRTDPDLFGMGTTITVLALLGTKAIMCHVGDSRLYMVRHDHVHQLSDDHTVAYELWQTGQLTREEADKSPYSNSLTRYLGNQYGVEVDSLLFDVFPNDAFVLCSDGVSNCVSKSRIVEFLKDASASDAVEEFVDFANACGGHDNATAIVIQIMDDEAGSSQDASAVLGALRSSQLFRGLSLNRLSRVINASELRRVSSGEIVLEDDEECQGLYLPISGNCYLLDEQGKATDLEIGQCVGVGELMRPSFRSSALVAAEDGELLFLSGEAFRKLTTRYPKLGRKLLTRVATALAEELACVRSGG